MNTHNKYKKGSTFVFVLSLLISSIAIAWHGGAQVTDKSGYPMGDSFGSNEEIMTNCKPDVTIVGSARAYVKSCQDSNVCPGWFRRYIINPIHGALRTTFD